MDDKERFANPESWTVEDRVLLAIALSEGKFYPNGVQFAAIVGISQSEFAAVCGRLYEKGFLTRKPKSASAASEEVGSNG
jgi:hypothetical protein